MSQLTIEFFSTSLNRPVQFKMIIPNDLNPAWNVPQERKGKPMKTLFLLHGYTGAAGNWVPEEYTSLYNMAIVMPSGENAFYVDGISSGHKFATFLGVELVEYVRKTFHLAMTPEDTFVMGLSMGGFGAIHTAYMYPETFGSAIALSSALIIHGIAHMKPGTDNGVANYEYYRECFGDLETVEQSRHNPEVLVEELLASGGKLPRLLMACGTEDFLLEPNRHFHRFLEEKGVAHEYFESKGIHDMNFWSEYARKLIPMLFAEETNGK